MLEGVEFSWNKALALAGLSVMTLSTPSRWQRDSSAVELTVQA